MRDQETVLRLYSQKILGLRLYKAAKQVFYASDFIRLDELERFLDELSTHESDLTPAGKAFLCDYWGLQKLATILADRGRLTEPHHPQNISWLVDWLANVEPLDTVRFIAEGDNAWGIGATLSEQLLPPNTDE